MSYSKVLNEIIAKANITQEELSKQCKELGSYISRGQINKISNGKAQAPNEKVSRAIAKVCNVDDKELVIAGYLEKAPKEFTDFLDVLEEGLLKATFTILENGFSKEEIEIFKEEYKKEMDSNIILQFLNMKNDIDMYKYLGQFLENNAFLTMEDDSMQDKIPKGSRLKIRVKEKYKNGDIALVKVHNKEKPVIRMIFFEGSKLCLYPFNNKYPSLLLVDGQYQIIGTISSVEIII